MADETETTQETQENKEQLIKCPCCGKLTLQKPLDIQSMVLDEYMASIIAGEPFQHTYTVYGNVDINVTVLSKSEGLKLYTVVQLLSSLVSAVNPADQSNKIKLEELSAMLQLYAGVVSITAHKDNRILKSYEPSKVIWDICDKLLEMQAAIHIFVSGGQTGEPLDAVLKLYETNCSEAVLSAVPDVMLRAIVRTHTDLYNILMNNGFDENFWKGIELA